MSASPARHILCRRDMLAAGLAGVAVATSARAQSSARADRLVFDIRRGAASIGRHEVVTTIGAGGEVVARITAEFVVRVGPVPVYRYRHTATETWRGGRFTALAASTVENGGRREVSALAAPGGVQVTVGDRTHVLPSDACPLTHWNPDALRRPLFNAQSGAAMAERVAWRDGRAGEGARVAELTGAATMTDAYDADGRWLALKLKAPDGSTIEYRRL